MVLYGGELVVRSISKKTAPSGSRSQSFTSVQLVAPRLEETTDQYLYGSEGIPAPLVLVATMNAAAEFREIAYWRARLSPLETCEAAVCNEEEDIPWMPKARIPIMMAMMATTTSNSTREKAAGHGRAAVLGILRQAA